MQQDSTDNITLTTDRRTDRATCTSSNTTAECQKWWLCYLWPRRTDRQRQTESAVPQ